MAQRVINVVFGGLLLLIVWFVGLSMGRVDRNNVTAQRWADRLYRSLQAGNKDAVRLFVTPEVFDELMAIEAVAGKVESFNVFNSGSQFFGMPTWIKVEVRRNGRIWRETMHTGGGAGPIVFWVAEAEKENELERYHESAAR